jgi:hypothetical protein
MACRRRAEADGSVNEAFPDEALRLLQVDAHPEAFVDAPGWIMAWSERAGRGLSRNYKPVAVREVDER